MSKLLPALREKYAGSRGSLAMFDDNDLEMAIHKKYAKSHGYEFFVCRRA
jgi:hypothetical protein